MRDRIGRWCGCRNGILSGFLVRREGQCRVAYGLRMSSKESNSVLRIQELLGGRAM